MKPRRLLSLAVVAVLAGCTSHTMRADHALHQSAAWIPCERSEVRVLSDVVVDSANSMEWYARCGDRAYDCLERQRSNDTFSVTCHPVTEEEVRVMTARRGAIPRRKTAPPAPAEATAESASSPPAKESPTATTESGPPAGTETPSGS